MILGFKQKFQWRGADKQPMPTNFREKILAGVDDIWIDPKSPSFRVRNISLLRPKLHTIREDKHDRWKPGMSIQMVYRGPKYSILDQFNKDIPQLQKCIGVQKIEIRYLTTEQKEKMKGTSYFDPIITVDGKHVDFGLTTLAKNDGFSDDTVVGHKMNFASDYFLKWFNKDFAGKIIHWSELRY
jgi:hypothetical protein